MPKPYQSALNIMTFVFNTGTKALTGRNKKAISAGRWLQIIPREINSPISFLSGD
jgi:hypothetical protein